MPFFLSERNTSLYEKMDDPTCSKEALYKTYRRFSVVNAIISRWKRIYQSYIRPLAAEKPGSFSLLDIGFGGGDIPLKMAKWAAADGFNLNITAIDTDQRALEYVQQLSSPNNIRFLQRSTTELLNQGEQFDIVISNHLLHHLAAGQMLQTLDEAKKLSKISVFFNDIERSDAAYLLFNLVSLPLSQGSFITQDGLASIKRSYTFRELQNRVPEEWNVERMFPYRLLLSYRHE
jgi:2-polyprenyl-3-methyl-5-hydroxy-6-metoxy-1,4-benzoquinol methylase